MTAVTETAGDENKKLSSAQAGAGTKFLGCLSNTCVQTATKGRADA
jgi:hypothetical protein